MQYRRRVSRVFGTKVKMDEGFVQPAEAHLKLLEMLTRWGSVQRGPQAI